MIGRGRVQIDGAAVWQGAEALTPATAEALGQQLRQRLRAAGLSPGPLLVCFSRDQVIVKEVRYPRTDAAQEATLIRFQATKELTESPETVVIDYVRQDRPGPAGELVAHVLIVRRDLVNAVKTMCKAAGLRLLALTPRAYGLAACLRQATAAGPPEGGADAILAVAEGMAEFCVARGEAVLAARPLPQAGAALVEDLRRNLSLYAGQPGALPVQALYVTGGDDTAALRSRLQGFSIPVRPLDPLAAAATNLGQVERAGFAGAVGLLYLWAEHQAVPANFAAPKEPRVTTESSSRRLLRVAGVAVLGLLVAILLTNIVLAGKRAEIDDLKDQRDQVDDILKRLQPDKRRLTELKDWHQSALPLLDELYDLTARFPFHKDLKVTRLEFAPIATRTGNTPAKGAGKGPTYTMRLTIIGQVPRNDLGLVRELVDQINQDSHCHADQPQIRDSGGEKSDGAQEFAIQVDLRPEGRYNSILVPPPPPRPVADDDDDDDGSYFMGG
jgi:Tfp pilus assembly PilM family ATPase